jgi:rod shape-determining protein MreB and related proteins
MARRLLAVEGGPQTMRFRSFARMFPSGLAVDLGTANVLVYAAGRGIVVDEPSIVALSTKDRSVLAVGAEAKAMLGRAPSSIEVIRPLRHGVIADYDATEKMLQCFIRKGHPQRSPVRPLVIVSVPSGITQVERRAVQDSASQAGAGRVHLVAEPTAAAIGAGLPISEPGANLVVDVGGGTTEVAVISLSGIVHCTSIRMAGDDMNEAIMLHVRKNHGLLIGERRAEEVKLVLGSAYPGTRDDEFAAVKGRDLSTGLPRTVKVSGSEVRDALREPVAAIADAVRLCLEQTPPELAADIVDSGIMLTGGGALLPGLDKLLHAETRLPVNISAEPLSCVVRGAGELLETPEALSRLALPI